MYDILTVTVNFKMKEKILEMLRSLFRDLEGTNLRVQPVIVDNASEDGIEESLKKEFNTICHPERSEGSPTDVGGADSAKAERDSSSADQNDRKTVIFINAGANVGFGRGNNLALKQFEAKYYFIANPDLVFLKEQPKTIERLYQFMEEHPKVGIVAPRLLLPDGTIQPSCLRFPNFFDPPLYRLGWHKKYEWARKRVARLHMKELDHRKTVPVDWATGAALFFRGPWLKEVGFFDERYFMYFEDADLCRTFWSRGFPVYYKGDVVVQHGHERASARVPGLKSVLLNKLTRIHIKSLLQYSWKWRGKTI